MRFCLGRLALFSTIICLVERGKVAFCLLNVPAFRPSWLNLYMISFQCLPNVSTGWNHWSPIDKVIGRQDLSRKASCVKQCASPRSRRAPFQPGSDPQYSIFARPTIPRIVICSKISPQSFDNQVLDRSLRICFVGMSNCGKSHWSNALKNECDFELLSVDEEIERAIEPDLRELGYSGIDGMAEWMGFPTDNRFEKNQKTYLTYEEAITAAACDALSSKVNNYVLDTTGSVVYLSEGTLQAVTSGFLVVHLAASDDMLDKMTDNYFATPKPVVWGNCFNRKDGEDPETALRRCYPKLLQERRTRYAKLADVSVPAAVSLSRELDLKKFMDYIRLQLSQQFKLPSAFA
jgi:hypothetical protein